MTDEKNKNDIKKVQMPNPDKLLVSSSPHLHSTGDIRKIMMLVILALLPACTVGVFYFGLPALKVLLICSVSCVFFEYICGRLMGRPNCWKDGSALLTGILLGMILSAGIPWWVCVIGSFIAIVLAKQIYGGIGYNPFNPALVARIALTLGFPTLMTKWVPTRIMDKSKFLFDSSKISESQISAIKSGGDLSFANSVIDGVSCATPLGEVANSRELGTATERLFGTITDYQNLWDYAIGDQGGCLGETCAIALLLGGLFLIFMKIIRWQIPVSYIGTVAVFSTFIHLFSETAPAIPGAAFQLLTGGLFIGAFFMATDMVSSPMTTRGAWIFGIGCGIVTCVIRDWASYPEGVMFAIVFMNAFTPLIDRYTRKKPFGFRPPEQKKGALK